MLKLTEYFWILPLYIKVNEVLDKLGEFYMNSCQKLLNKCLTHAVHWSSSCPVLVDTFKRRWTIKKMNKYIYQVVQNGKIKKDRQLLDFKQNGKKKFSIPKCLWSTGMSGQAKKQMIRVLIWIQLNLESPKPMSFKMAIYL